MSHESDQLGDTTVLHKTHDLSLTRDKRGLWTGTQVFYCHKDQLDTLAPVKDDEHPDYDWLLLEQLSVVGEPGDWLRLNCNYAGRSADGEGSGSDDPAVTEYSLDVALSEEPLETHPRYADALDADEISEAVNLAKNPPRAGDGSLKELDTSGWAALKLELYDYVRKGFVKFRDSKVTWTVSYVSNAQPTNLGDVGKSTLFPPGPPPLVAGVEKDWLFAGCTSRQRGAVVDITEVYELSGRGGWNGDIYT